MGRRAGGLTESAGIGPEVSYEGMNRVFGSGGWRLPFSRLGQRYSRTTLYGYQFLCRYFIFPSWITYSFACAIYS